MPRSWCHQCYSKAMTASKPHIDEAPGVGSMWYIADSEVKPYFTAQVTLQSRKPRASGPGLNEPLSLSLAEKSIHC